MSTKNAVDTMPPPYQFNDNQNERQFFETNIVKYRWYYNCMLLFLSFFCFCLFLLTVLYTYRALNNGPQQSHGSVPTSVSTVIAENTTVKVLSLPVEDIVSITVRETLLSGDYIHKGYATLVPNEKLKVKEFKGFKNFTGLTLDEAPILNVRFVYLLKSSVLNFHICIGNAPKKTTSTLYIFSDYDQYSMYLSGGIVKSAKLKEEITIAGKNESICSSFDYKALEDSYYFAVLIAPTKDIEISYTLKATEKVLYITDYLRDYPACQFQFGQDCQLLTDQINSTQNVSLLVLTEPNYDFYSKLIHVDIEITGAANSQYTIELVQEIVIATGGFVMLSVIVLILVCISIKRSKLLLSRRKGYKLIVND